MTYIPRGIRNNNPFNIKKTQISWLGEVHPGTDNVFEQFVSLPHGLRAGIVLLKNYIQNGYDTVEKIISRFAPSCENDTYKYISYVVSENPCLSRDSRIDVASLQFFFLLNAILAYESDYQMTYEQYKTICSSFHIMN